jgi:hypothetical protein
VSFEVPNADEYVGFVADTAGSLALVLRGLSAADREAIKARAEGVLEPFAGEGGYRIPGVALCAVAS